MISFQRLAGHVSNPGHYHPRGHVGHDGVRCHPLEVPLGYSSWHCRLSVTIKAAAIRSAPPGSLFPRTLSTLWWPMSAVATALRSTLSPGALEHPLLIIAASSVIGSVVSLPLAVFDTGAAWYAASHDDGAISLSLPAARRSSTLRSCAAVASAAITGACAAAVGKHMSPDVKQAQWMYSFRLGATSILAGSSIIGFAVFDKTALSSLDVEILAALASITGLVVGYHYGDASMESLVSWLDASSKSPAA
jgi:hypothetical protein